MALPGFRDFYPDDCSFRNTIFSHWRRVVQRYGFVEYDGPPLESLDLFTKKSGAEIVGQLYNFVDKGDREVALRPEMTPTLARLVTAKHKDYRKPLKWYAIPQVFRYERQQKGRLREHYQLNCDIVGEPGLEADIELIALVVDVLRSFGFTENDFVVRLSDRVFWSNFMQQHGVAEDQRYPFLQAIDLPAPCLLHSLCFSLRRPLRDCDSLQNELFGRCHARGVLVELKQRFGVA